MKSPDKLTTEQVLLVLMAIGCCMLGGLLVISIILACLKYVFG